MPSIRIGPSSVLQERTGRQGGNTLRDYEAVMTAPGSLAGRARALGQIHEGCTRIPRRRVARGPGGIGLDLRLPRGGDPLRRVRGSGIHPQAVYFAHVAHLRPGTFFAVLGGIIECFGGARWASAYWAGSPRPVSSATW